MQGGTVQRLGGKRARRCQIRQPDSQIFCSSLVLLPTSIFPLHFFQRVIYWVRDPPSDELIERLARGRLGDTGTCHSRSLRLPGGLLTPGCLLRHGSTLQPDPAGLSLTWRRQAPGTAPSLFPPPARCRQLQPAASAGSGFTTTPSSLTVKLTAESKQGKEPACSLTLLSLNIPFFPPLIKASWSCPSSPWPQTKAFGGRSIPFGPAHPCRNPPAWARQIYTDLET